MLLMMLRSARAGVALLLCGIAALFFAALQAAYPQAPFAPARDRVLAASIAYFVAFGAYQLRRIPRFA